MLKYEDEIFKLGAMLSKLYVFQKNIPAVRLYKKLGYHILREVRLYEAQENTRYFMNKTIVRN